MDVRIEMVDRIRQVWVGLNESLVISLHTCSSSVLMSAMVGAHSGGMFSAESGDKIQRKKVVVQACRWTDGQWKERIKIHIINVILVDAIHSFIHSGDLYSASSRHYTQRRSQPCHCQRGRT